MKKHFFLFAFILVSMGLSLPAKAQCNWQTVLSDGFEYATACPDLIPGTTIHTIPQAYAVHSGAKSLYLNFVNCVGGVGCCAGDTVYMRTVEVCKNMPIRFTAYLTTSFSGLQCNMKIVIVDGNNMVLDDQPAIQAPYAPSWTAYTSASVTPGTTTVKFIMITNVGGGNGNDLSMDDFLVEKCYPNSTSNYTQANLCTNIPQYNLFSLISGSPDTNGAWTGPYPLGGGYLGSFSTNTTPLGTYTYTSHYYGTGSGCPVVTEMFALSASAAPFFTLGSDTMICTTQTVILNPGFGAGWTYLWNTGASSQTLVASTNNIGGDTTAYIVTVTDINGCKSTDDKKVTFVLCTGIDKPGMDDLPKIFPNPASDRLIIVLAQPQFAEIVIHDLSSRILLRSQFDYKTEINIQSLAKGIYFYNIIGSKGLLYTGKLIKD
ncbi:MAG: T9SS type A sorting domain-containing protein [Bacteroidota bacterium]